MIALGPSLAIAALAVLPFVRNRRGRPLLDDDLVQDAAVFNIWTIRNWRSWRSVTHMTHALTPAVTTAHDFNLALHAGNAVLVYALLDRWFPAVALPAAAIFAVHPLQVFSAAYIASRCGMLSLFFCLILAALLTWGNSIWLWLPMLLVFWLAYHSKEDAPVYPLVIGAIAWLLTSR